MKTFHRLVTGGGAVCALALFATPMLADSRISFRKPYAAVSMMMSA